MTDALYRDHILDHARHPRNKGVLTNASVSAREANASCGDLCVFAMRFKAPDSNVEIVDQAMFDGHGCALSTAAASLLTEEVEGKSINDLKIFSEAQFLEMLGVEVTSGRLDCAVLPLRAMQKALGI